MSLLLYRVGHFCARHRWSVLAVWAVIAIGVVAASKEAGSQASDNLTLPGTGSTEATDLLDERLPKESNGTVPIVLESGSGKLTDSRNRSAVEAALRSLRREALVAEAQSPYGNPSAHAVSKDGRIGFISLTLTVGPDQLDEDEANAIIAAADPAERAGIAVSAGGYLGQEVSKPDTESSERLGILAAVLILLFTFGTAVAMALPISTAIVGVVIGLAGITLLSHLVDVPTVAPTLGTMIGLGVGIDYALFVVTRFRAARAAGMPVAEAVARACATSGSAVVFAGGTVVVALLSLALAGIPLVSALGYSAALVVFVAVLAAITLLPALLAILGPRVESFRVPFLSQQAHDDRPHGWARWAAGVARHPWPAIAVAVALLLALTVPLLDMRLGQQDYGVFPTDETARQSYDALREGFGPGANGSYLVAVDFTRKARNDQAKLNELNAKVRRQQQAAQQQVEQAASAEAEQLTAEGVPPDEAQAEAEQDAQSAAPQQSKAQKQRLQRQREFLSSPASDPRLVHLQNRIGATAGVDSVSPAKVDRPGSAAVFSVTPTTAPAAQATSDLVNRLRDDVIPAATAGKGLTAHVGGVTAGYIDLAERISEKLVTVILIVVALSFVLLATAFRSILVPITAAAMNLLSVGAAYGVLTLVFEEGFLLGLIGLDHTIPIVSFVPLLMFAILFGLSMDYQVFLVSRIHEHWTESGDNRSAVVEGLASSARVITSAALIMVAVFSSFVLNGDPTVKQFGVGMAVAIALDATIVRCLLVPAVMVLLGRSNWWFPRRLDRVLPRLGLESEESLPAVERPARAG